MKRFSDLQETSLHFLSFFILNKHKKKKNKTFQKLHDLLQLRWSEMHLLIYGNYYSYVRSGPRKTFYSLVEFTFNALSSMQAQAATPPTLGLIIIIIVALSSAITALWDEWLPRNSK